MREGERGRVIAASPERMSSSMISAFPRYAAACRGVRFSRSWRRKRVGDLLHNQSHTTNHQGIADTADRTINTHKQV